MKKLLVNMWYRVPGVQWDNIEDRIWDVMPKRFWESDYGLSEQLENVAVDFWIADRVTEAAENGGKAIGLKFSRLHYSKRRLLRVAKDREAKAKRQIAYSQAKSLEELARTGGSRYYGG